MVQQIVRWSDHITSMSWTLCIHAQQPLTAGLVVDPRQELGDVGVDAGVVGTRAAPAVTDDAILQPPVGAPADQRTTRVAGARVAPALHVPGAQHVRRQAYPQVALAERNDRNLDLPQDRVVSRLYNTQTHPFNGPSSGTTQVSWYQKGETNLDFTGARDSEQQWHQLGRMQVCTSLQTDNHTSTPPLSFLQAGCPSCRPTNGVKALKAWWH